MRPSNRLERRCDAGWIYTRESAILAMLYLRRVAPLERRETPMADSEKILRDLQALTQTIDLDRTDLGRLTMPPETRKAIQQHIARCLHSLRELEFVLEGQKPVDEGEADFLI